MKKLLILSLCIFALSFSFVNAAESESGYISVTERMTKDVLPNEAKIVVSVETFAQTAQKASSDNKVLVQKVNSALKKLLSVNDTIKTGDYSLTPQYIYTKENKKILDKYRVNNSIIIEVKNIKLVSKLIDTAISNGATKIDNLEFTSSNYDKDCEESLIELTKKAKVRANIVANSIGASVSGIKSINTSCNPQYSGRNFYAMMKATSDSVENSTIIESGKIKIDVLIDAMFYVK